MRKFLKKGTTLFLTLAMCMGVLSSCGDNAATYKVSVSVEGKGSVVADKTKVEEGENVTFRITPEENYMLSSLIVNGREAELPESGDYTLCSVTENITISAEFASTLVTVRFDTNGAGDIPTQTTIYGGSFGALPVPESEQPFVGWFVSESEDAEEIRSTSIVNAFGEITLYAKYYEETEAVGKDYEPYSITATYYDQAATKLGITFHTADETHAAKILLSESADMSGAVAFDCETVAWADHYVSQGVIEGLEFGKQYYYKLGDSLGNVWSDVFSYKMREDKQETSFIMITDTQQTLLNKNTEITDANGNGTGEYGIPEGDTARVLADATKRFDYDYILHVGDLVNYAEDMGYWAEMLGDMQKYITAKPLIFAIGNHEDAEYYGGDLPDIMPKMFHIDYPEQKLINGGLFYSLDIGAMHLIVLRLNDVMRGNKLSEEQITWLKEDLRIAKANPDIKWTVAALHEGIIVPTFSSLTSNNNHQPWLRPQLMPIFDEYDVDIVFNGHNHYIDSTYPLVYDPTAGNLDGDSMNDYVRIVTKEYTSITETNEYGRAEKIDVFNDYHSGKDGTIFHQIGTAGRQFNTIFTAAKLQENLATKYYYRNLLSGGAGAAIEGDPRTYSMYAYVQIDETSFTCRTYGVNYNTVYDYVSEGGEHTPLLDAIRLYK